MRERGKVVSISDVSTRDRSHNELNGMPDFSDIEEMVIARETAEGIIRQFGSNSPEAEKARQFMASMENTHAAADQNDADGQCEARPPIRNSINRF